MSTQYQISRDISGATCGTNSALPFAVNGFDGALAANVAQSVTVPGNYKHWIAVIGIQANTTVYIDGITTAAVPSGVFAASTVEIIPVIGLTREVIAGQTLSFITAEASGAIVTVKFYVKDLYANVN